MAEGGGTPPILLYLERGGEGGGSRGQPLEVSSFPEGISILSPKPILSPFGGKKTGNTQSQGESPTEKEGKRQAEVDEKRREKR